MSEVDNLIASITPDAPEAVEAKATPEPEVEANAEPEAEQPEGDAPEAETPEQREWDEKRAKNRISRQDKRIDKLTWEKHQLNQTIAELQAQLSKPLTQQTQNQPSSQSDGEPKESDYAGRFDEYVVAKATWQAEQRAKSVFEQQQQNAAAQTQQQQAAQQFQEMVSKADKAAADFIKEVPDAIAAQQDFEDLDLSPHAAMAVIGLGEQAPKAVYQLWKAGKLDELETANPMQAQILLASALATPFSKPVTKAPAPIRSVKGTTPSAINPDNYSPDELLKLIRKK